MSTRSIIWDLGNVLVDWSPRYLYDKIFKDSKERDHFLEHICTMEWHNTVDGGRPVKEATEQLVRQHPAWEQPIRAFYARWKEMFQGEIEGSVAILRTLKEKGFSQYALSNWSAELFEQSRCDFPFLDWFDGIVLSGAERMTKPHPGLYLVLLERFNINAATAVYIDDRESNVATAVNLGMDGIVFRDPETLRRDLKLRGLL
ncbi:HAD family phosphatase [Flaviaesturariibacter flavus]|uniref:HAD family phosphatase n=1 Tax=Flaviaesturariibacter flavus TaxID=2502780 RepID=A0A4R1BAG5_9BACT|nr:HAD family phosphatase [Flaviaesturariibacter flavus]TCJ13951.1 HAD family phosphatase [Flaviaesturariibacter flavus]